MEPFSFAKYFGEVNVLADLQSMPDGRPYIDRPAAAPEPKDLLLYLGCNVLRTGHLARTAIDVLKAMGFEFNAAGGPAHCCGIVHQQHGETATARGIAANSMRHFARYGAKEVLMWCPSCHSHYDEVVTQEQAVAFPYEHVTAFIARHLDRVKFVRPVEKRVALHYHTGFAQSDTDWRHTRTILQAIPGLELVEVENPATLGRHCAPKWIGRIGRPQWEREIAGILGRAAEARVDVLATLYHSCHREICHQEAAHPLAIVNYISLLGEAMGIEHPDVYKRWKLMADPDAILAEARPFIEANGLDPDRVREVVNASFAPAAEAKTSGPS
ncbi:MAG TPA: heterodisulfide reductase-related iron-sulfur binding cluster [Stellaceae bacterium]|nr:heterodisulfide reductase-related iron-sulfur binding cluster [Stellaceae bacterium]